MRVRAVQPRAVSREIFVAAFKYLKEAYQGDGKKIFIRACRDRSKAKWLQTEKKQV